MNYKNELTQVANQVARYAAVNKSPIDGRSAFPGCGAVKSYFASSSPLHVDTPEIATMIGNGTLAITPGSKVGDPVTVKFTTTFGFLPFIGSSTFGIGQTSSSLSRPGNDAARAGADVRRRLVLRRRLMRDARGAVAVLVALMMPLFACYLRSPSTPATGGRTPGICRRRRTQERSPARRVPGSRRVTSPRSRRTRNDYSGVAFNKQYQPSGAVTVLLNSTDLLRQGRRLLQRRGHALSDPGALDCRTTRPSSTSRRRKRGSPTSLETSPDSSAGPASTR